MFSTFLNWLGNFGKKNRNQIRVVTYRPVQRTPHQQKLYEAVMALTLVHSKERLIQFTEQMISTTTSIYYYNKMSDALMLHKAELTICKETYRKLLEELRHFNKNQ